MKRVLIVDDSLTVRMDLGEAFSSAGFDTVLCATAAEARTALAGKPHHGVDLIVLDVVLPDADGVELLAELRGDPVTETIPIMLLSSESEVSHRIRGLTGGANEYVGKPYDRSYVIARAVALMGTDAPSGGTALVLVVDDSLTYRQEVCEQLASAGYRTATATSGEEGLQRADEVRPDAIIVDGVMAGIDGTAFIRRIRLDPALYTTPCLLLTASDAASSEVDALDAGADAYVRKSAGTDVVLARVAAMLRSAEQSRERGRAASLLSPKRILAVDDSATYLEQLAEQLRREGYEVVKARSGEEALELLVVECPDAILLDLIMPGLSGTETCAHIKGLPILRNTPLIMLTALDDPQALIEGMNAGADDYVVKSAAFDVIKARLRAQLRRKHIEDENRRVREEIVKKDAEARAAHEKAQARAVLLDALEQRNDELKLLNKELQMFAYSVSHDLRQPLRSLDGFSKALLADYSDRLDDKGRHYLERIRAGAQRMDQLIEGLLLLSRVTRQEPQLRGLRLDMLAQRVLKRLQDADPARHIEAHVDGPIEAFGDEQLMESALENLLGNAWKFTAEQPKARIEVGVVEVAGAPAYFVRDNGSGFDMKNAAGRLFVPFQRLHQTDKFAGTGIGLATTQRIILRHGGKIWADSVPGDGATFYFTLARERETS